MASDALVDSYFKAARANVHLDELKRVVAEFVAANSSKVTVEEDPDKDQMRYRVVFEQPHVGMYLIAGDVFNCLRASLDQAVWWFARQGHPDPTWTQFPIFGEDTPANERRFRRYTAGIPSKAIDIIKELQPYNRSKGMPVSMHPLWQLNEINRVDKHRRILVRATGTLFWTRFEPYSAVTTNDGYEITLPFGRGVGFQPRFSPLVLFGDERTGISITVENIEMLHDLVALEILPRLAGCAQ